MITYLGIKAKERPQKCKNGRYAIRNVSKNNLSKTIRGFEKLPYESYERKRPKHEPNDSYFYLTIQFDKFMMRYDCLNSHGYPLRTEMTATKQILSSHVYFTDESELKEFLVNKNLL